jgi:hypothetical protein
MSYSGCEEFMWWFCARQASDSEFREKLRLAMDTSADPYGTIVGVIRDTDAKIAPVAEQELAELPPVAIKAMLDAWREASDAGLEFEARSVVPDRPVEFARKRRVRVVVDREDDAIRVALSHIPTRHPGNAAK